MDDELARALSRSYEDENPDAWAVYADQLADEDEPRGELIALELRLQQLDARGDDDDVGDDVSDSVSADRSDDDRDALWARRMQLLADNSARWLGEAAASSLENVREKGVPSLSWRFGYLRALSLRMSFDAGDARRAEQVVDALLDSDAARFLKRLSCEVAHASAIAGVARAIARQRRCVTQLALDAWHRSAPQTVVDAEGCAALADALPKLRALTLRGSLLLQTLAHERLETLTISGSRSIAALGATPPSIRLPALHRLDVAMMVGTMEDRVRQVGVQPEVLAAIICDPGLGALRSLDLSRNQPGAHGGEFLGGTPPPVYQAEVFEAIARRQLQSLRLPTPVGEADDIEAALRGAASGLAAIEELSIPRLYTYHAALDADALRRIAPTLRIDSVLPHRPSSSVHGREVLDISSADESSSVWVGFASLMEEVEACYPELAPEHRAAIDALIEAFEEIDYYEEGDGRPLRAELPRAPLHAALAAMGADGETAELTMNRRVLQMFELLGNEAHDHVVIEKVWGW